MPECEICHEVVEAGVYRCPKCDKAWHKGYDFGYKARTTEVKNFIYNLMGGDAHE